MGEEGYTMEKKRLLLVDDDQVARELIEEFMQYDCDCISTQNGVEGFPILRETRDRSI